MKARKVGRQRAGFYPILIITFLLLTVSTGVLPGLDLLHSKPYAESDAPRTIPNTDVNPYGANFFLQLEVENWKIDTTLRMAAEAGIGWVKQHFPWESIEHEPGRFWDDRHVSTWEKYDYIVDQAARHGLQVIARLDRPPVWAREPGTTPQTPPSDFAAYGRFVQEVAKRYKGRIHYYQIWNEPNLTEEWGGRPVSPREYVDLLKIAYTAIKQADPNAHVLSAPLAQTLEENRAHLSDILYLEEMYKHGAKPYFDILFANAYGFDLPPEDPPDPGVLNFQRVVLQREVMERYGDGGKAVWFNEFGWNASPVDMPAEAIKWGRVTEQEQAEYTVRAIEMARRDWPWAGVFNIWFFRQPGHIPPDDSQFYFRVVDVGFTPRPVYRALREATPPLKVAGPGRYQETNPALAPHGGWHYVIDERAESRGLLASERPGDAVTISFNGGSIALIAQTDVDGGRLYVKLDGNGVEGLPRDAAGMSYIELYSPTPEWQAIIPVASNLRPRAHELELTVSSGQHATSLGRRVAIDGFVVGRANAVPWLEAGVGMAGLITVLTLFWWRRRRAAARPR